MNVRRQSAFLLTAAAALVLAGCQSAPRKTESGMFFPGHPERPRVQYLTWMSGADEVEPRKGKFEDYLLGQEPTVKRTIQKPYGIAIHDGVAFVCDTKGLSLCRLDFMNRAFAVFGTSGPGRLRKPLNVIVDPRGYKFVVDAERKQVVVFGPTDSYVTAFDTPAPCHPVDIALYENELYVLDNDESCQVVVMDRTSGSVLRTFGGPGGEPGQFKIPNSIAISPDGFVYVSDTHNWRIQKLTRTGESVWVKGTPGYHIGQFGRPRGLRVGPDGIVYVVDGATEIVQMFDPDGTTLMHFGGPGDVPGAMALPSSLVADKDSLTAFKEYIHPDFKAEYLLFVANQVGERLINVYAFGAFPADYQLPEAVIQSLPTPEPKKVIGPVVGDEVPPEPGGPPEGEGQRD